MVEKSKIKLAVQKLNRRLHAEIDRSTLQQKVILAKELRIELPDIIKHKVEKFGIKV
jgi:hypothetical protein